MCGMAVAVILLCGLTILTQALGLTTAASFGVMWRGYYDSTSPSPAGFFLSDMDPQLIDSHVDECRALESLPPMVIRLNCTPLTANHSRVDLIDQISLMSNHSVAHMVKQGSLNIYLRDLSYMLTRLPDRKLLRQGDHPAAFAVRLADDTQPAPFPIMSKARKVRQENVTLIPMNYNRHFGDHFIKILKEGDPIAYEDKKPVAFWRGTTTGWGWNPSLPTSCARRHLIEKWGTRNTSTFTTTAMGTPRPTKLRRKGASPLVDVGLSFLAQDAKYHAEHYEPYLKPKQTAKEQLQYRYLIAVEGNDVATSLKWMLASNSTVLMPPPTMESWLRESCLIPWVHYVPLKPDTSDLEDKIRLCERHLRKCKAIAREATNYVKMLSSRHRVFGEAAKQIRLYMEAVKFELVEPRQALSDWPLVKCQVCDSRIGVVGLGRGEEEERGVVVHGNLLPRRE